MLKNSDALNEQSPFLNKLLTNNEQTKQGNLKYEAISMGKVIPFRPENWARDGSGAPNENIVQNHLNIALLTYFSI